MKTKTIKSNAIIAFVASSLCIAADRSTATPLSPSPLIKTQFFILTADGSPSNSACLQNAMSFMDKGETVGYISTNLANDPTALDMPHVLRGCQIISGPAGFELWDSTNSPTGNFTNNNGSRIGWGVDWQDTNQFLASSISFRLWSTEPANTLYYTGNLATNTFDGTPLVFSSTLRGELWNTDGTVTSYHNGETTADHPINRIIGLIRESYYATSMSTVASDLSYFKDEMNFMNYASFTMYDSAGNVVAGATNQISSLVYIDTPVRDAFGEWYVQIEGQRQMGFTYYLLQTPSLNDPIVWNTIAGGSEGLFRAGADMPDSFFRGFESNGVSQAFSANIASFPHPTIRVSNRNE